MSPARTSGTCRAILLGPRKAQPCASAPLFQGALTELNGCVTTEIRKGLHKFSLLLCELRADSPA
jgi:hypothetical protein